ncbi:MAG: transaldolase [Actinomycetes bacterium]
MAGSSSLISKVAIFADGADIEGIKVLAADPTIKGFTTNPTLMNQAGIQDYEAFSKQVIEVVGGLPLSLEVFTDDIDEMETQARKIASWGEGVFVKIPVTNTKGVSTAALVERLAGSGVQVNVTALFTVRQVEVVAGALSADVPAFVSVFAGRIADAGQDPIPIMTEALEVLRPLPEARLIWASPRELLNIVQADQIGCDVITVTHDLLKKLPSLGKDLDQFSLETVKMFFDDGTAAGYRI